MSRNFGKTAIFYFWTKAMLLFNPFTREYFDNLALKKNKYGNFKQLYLKRYSEFRVKTSIFEKFIQFSLKQDGFFARPIHVGTRQKAAPPSTPGVTASGLTGSKS